jgi:thioredoxin-related protein
MIIKALYIAIILSSICMLPKFSFSQLKEYQFEQIDSLQASEKRSVAIYLHTDWCKYCHAMKNTTLKDKNVIKLLNEKFYFIDFDAEEKRTIIFNNKSYSYKPSGNNTGLHELATRLDKEITFPSLIFLNDTKEIIFKHNQYISSKDLISILLKLP